jgi:hypothetical protein
MYGDQKMRIIMLGQGRPLNEYLCRFLLVGDHNQIIRRDSALSDEIDQVVCMEYRI